MIKYFGYFFLTFFGIYYFVFFICVIYLCIEEEWFCKNQIPEWKERMIRSYLNWREGYKYQRIDDYVPEIDFNVERLEDII
tara:strand:- start:76 stop:318 length:243 start_codon:yes stop_codon:yes gene_type:complete